MHDLVADDSYCRQVITELWEKLGRTTTSNTHGGRADGLIFDILQKADQPRTDKNRGTIGAIFSTGSEAASRAESGSPSLPIFAESQQQFRWSGQDRPIAELFRRMEDLDWTVSVQIPSRSSTAQSFESRKLSEVQERFLSNLNADGDPRNILDLRSPLPPSDFT